MAEGEFCNTGIVWANFTSGLYSVIWITTLCEKREYF